MANPPLEARKNLPSELQRHCRCSFNYSLTARENLAHDPYYVRSDHHVESPVRSTGSTHHYGGRSPAILPGLIGGESGLRRP